MPPTSCPTSPLSWRATRTSTCATRPSHCSSAWPTGTCEHVRPSSGRPKATRTSSSGLSRRGRSPVSTCEREKPTSVVLGVAALCRRYEQLCRRQRWRDLGAARRGVDHRARRVCRRRPRAPIVPSRRPRTSAVSPRRAVTVASAMPIRHSQVRQPYRSRIWRWEGQRVMDTNVIVLDSIAGVAIHHPGELRVQCVNCSSSSLLD